MESGKAVPEETQEKKQGDKLDGVLGKGTGLTQDTPGGKPEPTPAEAPLK